ncbi:MAG: type II toxin-antitoxin system RelE family toxin [Janthinobacterium lividum]
MRKLDMTRDAAKFLQDLDAKQYKQVAAKMLSLMVEATPNDYSQLMGYPYYRVDSGEYRIIYRFDEDTVYITLIGKRNGDEVYNKLKRRS